MYTYYDKEINTKILILSKEVGCKYCSQLDMFLNYALEGRFNDQITKVYPGDYYDLITQGEGFLALPVIINLETGESLTGFDPTQVIQILEGNE